jgi:hypothetical protein
MATHTAQKHFWETEESSRDFILMMQERTVDRNRDDILNMDQTPIAYSYHSNKTLDTRGSRTVHIHASTTDTKRVTVVAATVIVSGKMLPPFMIFKGAPTDALHLASLALTLQPENAHARGRCGWTKTKCMHGSTSSLHHTRRRKTREILIDLHPFSSLMRTAFIRYVPS